MPMTPVAASELKIGRICAFIMLALSGCESSHDMSLQRSCQEWIGLGQGINQTSDNDVRKALPRWHEAVADPALSYVDAMKKQDSTANGSPEELAAIRDGIVALSRLHDLCGNAANPKY